ncbi:MAG: hypothetical protein IKW06_04470 [Clostridia bacterium]|nr:hypothetical protein [Clostridia bacterium]
MADHTYKPSEVPKGQRFQYFLDYYKWPFIITIILVIGVVSFLKSTVFRPKTDVPILVTSSIYVSHEIWNAATESMASMPLDFDEDGKSLATINYIYYDKAMEKTDLQNFLALQTKLAGSLAAAESALQILDEETFLFFNEQELLGTYSELPDTFGHAADELIKIPLKELAPFNTINDLPDGLYITLRPKNAMQIGNSKKKLAFFEHQVEALMQMIADNPNN